MPPNTSLNTYQREGAYPQPEMHIDPKEKGEKYHKQWAEYIFSAYIRDRGGLLYSKRSEFQMLRLYADGNQPVEKYMDILDPKDENTHERKGLMNISWDIISVAPRIREAVVGNYMKLDHDITINAIDEKSGADKEQMEHRAWAEKQLQPFFESVNPALAQQMRSSMLPFLPDSMEEIEMMKQIGAFKLKDEIAMEKALDYTWLISDWVDIKRRLYEDLFDLGIAATKDYVEPSTQLVKTRYVDPAKAIVNYSSDHNFRNLRYAGEIVEFTAGELRKAAPDLSEEQIQDCVKRATKATQHLRDYEFDYYSHGEVNGAYSYDEVRIPVLDIEWFDYDIKKGEKRKENGRESFYDKPFSYKGKKSETRTPQYSRLQTVRKCKWVVGTEYVFDWGYQNDIPRPSKEQARLSYHFYKASNKSKLAAMIPHLDNIQLTYLKMKNAIAKAAPAGLAIEVGSLNNISLGTKKMQPLDVLDIRRITGDLLFKSTNTYAQVVSPNSGKPVTETNGGVGPFLQELINTLELEMKYIRDVTGINEFVDASTPDPNTPVGTGKLAVASANNVLHTLYIGYQRIHECTAEQVLLRWQIVARANKGKKLVYPAIGKNAMETIKLSSDTAVRTYGLRIEERPTAEEIMETKQMAIASMQKRATGGPGITLADFQVVSRMLKAGQPKQAEMFLSWREQKSQEEIDQRNQRNQQMNADIQAQGIQQKTQGEITKIAEEGKWKIEIENTKSRNRMEEEKLRHFNKLEYADKLGDDDITKAIVKHRGDESRQIKEHENQQKIVDKQTKNNRKKDSKEEVA